ncbi:hypothetical protein OROGR_020521 [Orobanche gracilis]
MDKYGGVNSSDERCSRHCGGFRMSHFGEKWEKAVAKTEDEMKKMECFAGDMIDDDDLSKKIGDWTALHLILYHRLINRSLNSTKLGEFNNIFHMIVRAAQHPHLSIPETSAGKIPYEVHFLNNKHVLINETRELVEGSE